MEIKAILETVRAERDEHEAENLELKKQIEGLKKEKDNQRKKSPRLKLTTALRSKN